MLSQSHNVGSFDRVNMTANVMLGLYFGRKTLKDTFEKELSNIANYKWILSASVFAKVAVSMW